MKVLSVEQITSEKWVNLFAATFRHKRRSGRWVFASRKAGPDPYKAPGGGDAVLIVPVLHAKRRKPRLVAIREFRVPVGGYIIGFPAGLLEPGESLEDAVRREMREETGLEVTAIKRVSPPLYSSAGLTDEAVAVAFVDVRAVPGGAAALDGSEDIEVLLLDYDGVRRICEDPDARMDAKAWMAMYLIQQMGKIA
jgi:ADP-ribose pyrophosphatase